jgi:hypothetical protein
MNARRVLCAAVMAGTCATFFSSCVLLQGHTACCKYQGNFEAADASLVKSVTPPDPEFKFGRHNESVYVAHATGDWQSAPPILLLHEMPGLTPDTLELAHCLAGHGYTVYVPLLFGNLGEDTDSNGLFLKRVTSLKADPDWKEGFRLQPAHGCWIPSSCWPGRSFAATIRSGSALSASASRETCRWQWRLKCRRSSPPLRASRPCPSMSFPRSRRSI